MSSAAPGWPDRLRRRRRAAKPPAGKAIRRKATPGVERLETRWLFREWR
jgi:hypothetical protein